MADDENLFGELPVQLTPQPILEYGLGRVWTQHKAVLIAKYIYLFTIITRHGAYIDGFAAPKEDLSAGSWAAKAVAETEPRRLRELFFCELKPKRAALIDEMIAEQPDREKRHYEVLQGDFNVRVHDILGSGLIRPKTATFCLIDQFSIECHWSTLQALADYKPAGERKIELFYFLATGWLGRTLDAQKRNLDRPALWWGDEGWQNLIGVNGDKVAIRMCQRFRDELGYRFVKPYPIWERDKGKGRVMFHMIHASDHPAAHGLMQRAHRNVTQAPETHEQLVMDLQHIEP
ncbi:three-Cys-motif partner protein TcmP [Amorphus orientalis]|uniref:Three-Cys-motif partner protein n=1 Tax=Amorphus orientalis TaxID=649198 RepID=A0AAE3VQG2_9HYPH|nr:three-Cys-motif partner protein TcmP [Amorphus orientalis]MDQ0316252.1 three-Cys-motif partner protein [Amorphus orientalis]